MTMAADHGVAEARRLGISVGSDRPRNFASGGAAINMLARQFGARVVVVDVGIAAEFSQALPILHRKIAFSTANFAHGPAMTPATTLAAIGVRPM